MKRREFVSSVSPRGQVTLPAEIRKELGIKSKDRVTIDLQDGAIVIRPAASKLLAHYQKAGKLKQPLDWDEVTRIAWDEHAQHVAREGLEE